MMRQRCRTCGGIYSAVQADGTRYFHTCPPIERVRVLRADGSRAVVDPEQVLPTDTILEPVLVERPNHRDENVVPVPGGEGRPRAVGRGAPEDVP